MSTTASPEIREIAAQPAAVLRATIDPAEIAATVERGFPVVMFAPGGVTKKSSIELLKRLNELNADCLSITNDAAVAKLSPNSLVLAAEIDEFLSPIPFIVPAQLFAAFLSTSKGLDPDAPRSLSKVTKTI